MIGGGAVVVVVVLFFLFRAIFASMVPAAADTYAVPRLIGMTEEQANQQASVADGTFQVVVAGTEASDAAVGEIVRQDPEPETEKKGELPITINVWLSAGEDVGTMLNVTDMTYAQAEIYLRDLIEEYELVLQPEEEAQQEFSEEVDAGNIMSTTPAEGEALHKGDTITFVISKGPQTVPLINCEGQERSWAEDQLKNVLGLEVEVHEEASDTVREGLVIRQNPTATTQVPAGSTVELWVSTGPETSGGQIGEEQLLIALPTDRETAEVQIVVDGKIVFNEPVDCRQGNFPYMLRGTGTVSVEVYVDGEMDMLNTREVNLDDSGV